MRSEPKGVRKLLLDVVPVLTAHPEMNLYECLRFVTSNAVEIPCALDWIRKANGGISTVLMELEYSREQVVAIVEKAYDLLVNAKHGGGKPVAKVGNKQPPLHGGWGGGSMGKLSKKAVKQ